MSTDIHDAVRDRYRRAVTDDESCCGSGAAESCGCGDRTSDTFGYSFEELKSIPEGADLSLGCGNPTAVASIADGETVVDLGSGAGIDCFLAAPRVGSKGRVIGVDMTPEMVSRARSFATDRGYTNVEFRLGEIEHLPIADQCADLIISNCVINLAPDKTLVFAEAYRVLKPGGRMIISDIVLTRELPPNARENMTLLTGCVAGAALEEDYLAMIREAGFASVVVEQRKQYAKPQHMESLARDAGIDQATTDQVAEATASITVRATKAAS